MFSKKMFASGGAVVLISLMVLVAAFRHMREPSTGGPALRTALFLISPLQTAVSAIIDTAATAWSRYFFLVHAARENESLKKQLTEAKSQENQWRETLLENGRLRQCLDLKALSPYELLAAEVVARDPSPLVNSIIINRGTEDGVGRGCPVLVSEGVVGYVLEASGKFAKILLIVDRNSAVDALVQETRARGIAEGTGHDVCRLNYALRQIDVPVGAPVVTSGFDGIYPKGLRVGIVSRVVRKNSGLFQDIELTPSVDFKKLEEVMIVLNPPVHDFKSK